jgi:hypothetical protein
LNSCLFEPETVGFALQRLNYGPFSEFFFAPVLHGIAVAVRQSVLAIITDFFPI